jgi:DNA-binding MarR family transcriptional regulator
MRRCCEKPERRRRHRRHSKDRRGAIVNLESIVMNHRLPSRELRVLIVLHRLAGPDGQTTATQTTLARLAGIAQPAIGGRVHRLVKAGLLEKSAWNDGRSKRYRYRLVDAA